MNPIQQPFTFKLNVEFEFDSGAILMTKPYTLYEKKFQSSGTRFNDVWIKRVKYDEVGETIDSHNVQDFYFRGLSRSGFVRSINLYLVCDPPSFELSPGKHAQITFDIFEQYDEYFRDDKYSHTKRHKDDHALKRH